MQAAIAVSDSFLISAWDVELTLPANFVRQLLICVVLSIVFYAAWAAYGGVAEVWSSITALGVVGWSLVLGLSLLNYLLRFVRWEYYLRQLGYRVPIAPNAAIYLAGFGFTATPGKLGEAVRALYLKPYSVTYTHGLAVFFVERFVDMLAIVIVASLAAYEFANMRWLVGLTLLAIFACLPFVHSVRLLAWLDRARQRLKPGRLQTMGDKLLNMLRSSSVLLRSGPLYIGLLLGLVAWFAEGYGLYIVLERLGADTPLLLAAGIYGVGVLAGAVAFLPGGLGGTELVMGSLLMLAGVDAPVAVSAVIICRLATLWFAVLIGLVFVMGIELKSQRKSGSRPQIADSRISRE